MTHRHIYMRPAMLKIIVAAMLTCNSGPAAAEQIKIPGDFRLGSSLDEAKRHALSQGWQLLAISPDLPNSWLVKEQDIGVHLCGNIVGSVTQSSPGDLDDFAQIVSSLQTERGKPTIQIGSFMAGSTLISSIDARFAEEEGIGIVVQFSSTAGKLAISTGYFSAGCSQRSNDR